MIAIHDRGYLTFDSNQFFNIGKLDISDFSENIPQDIASKYDEFSIEDYSI